MTKIESRSWEMPGRTLELSIEESNAPKLYGGQYVVWTRMHNQTPQGRNTNARHQGCATVDEARTVYAAAADKLDALVAAAR